MTITVSNVVTNPPASGSMVKRKYPPAEITVFEHLRMVEMGLFPVHHLDELSDICNLWCVQNPPEPEENLYTESYLDEAMTTRASSIASKKAARRSYIRHKTKRLRDKRNREKDKAHQEKKKVMDKSQRDPEGKKKKIYHTKDHVNESIPICEMVDFPYYCKTYDTTRATKEELEKLSEVKTYIIIANKAYSEFTINGKLYKGKNLVKYLSEQLEAAIVLNENRGMTINGAFYKIGQLVKMLHVGPL